MMNLHQGIYNLSDRLAKTLTEAVSEAQLDTHTFIKRFATGGFSKEAMRWWAMKMLPGSNRFNQAFLKVASRMEDYRARVVILRNIYTEHGELNPEKAHVALFMRFMHGINCPRVDVNEDDGAYAIPELRFKRFELQDNEPVLRALGRFAAIEVVLPGIFTQYIDGLRTAFPGISDRTIEYFLVHCELDPTHTAELLEVASLYVQSEADISIFRTGVEDMLRSISDMFSWMNLHIEQEIDNQISRATSAQAVSYASAS